jgi:hypothetical protein
MVVYDDKLSINRESGVEERDSDKFNQEPPLAGQKTLRVLMSSMAYPSVAEDSQNSVSQ